MLAFLSQKRKGGRTNGIRHSLPATHAAYAGKQMNRKKSRKDGGRGLYLCRSVRPGSGQSQTFPGQLPVSLAETERFEQDTPPVRVSHWVTCTHILRARLKKLGGSRDLYSQRLYAILSPFSPRSSMAEQRTLNATVRGSTPPAGISTHSRSPIYNIPSRAPCCRYIPPLTSQVDISFLPAMTCRNRKNRSYRQVKRRRPIFPWGCPQSIIGAEELNCRVRDGNGCTLFAIATGSPAHMSGSL
jgi:hypothetical protein